MTAFLKPASGGLQPINGKNGAVINDAAAADRGKPGQQFVPNRLNVIEAAKNISLPISNCDPQAQLQRVQQQVQQRVQQAVIQQITQNIQQAVQQDASIQNLQQQMQSLQQQQQQGQDISQQLEIIEKETQSQIQKIIAGAVAKAAQQMPNATKVANTAAAGLKPTAAVVSVAEQLQAIEAARKATTVKTVQQVSQACFL